MLEILSGFWQSTGLSELFQCNTELFGLHLPGELIMICIACIFLYLAIHKGYEPYLLIPIAFGMLLVNLPLSGLMAEAVGDENGGLLYYLYLGTEYGIYPPLIFLCIGAGTDFGPLLANPRSLLLGAAAQLGIFVTFIGAIMLGFTGAEAASIGIIGGADGPTALYLTTRLAPHLLGPIAIAAYSYMALVPVIQPPIMRLLTTEEERGIKMEQLREVSQAEKIVFPIVVTLFTVLILPSAAALIGMLMLGNLLKESGKVPLLVSAVQNSLMYIVSILLGTNPEHIRTYSSGACAGPGSPTRTSTLCGTLSPPGLWSTAWMWSLSPAFLATPIPPSPWTSMATPKRSRKSAASIRWGTSTSTPRNSGWRPKRQK